MIRFKPSAILEITDFCNLKCPFCYENIRRRKGHIQFDTFVSILSARKPIYLQITGGEPTVHPRFRDLIRHALNKVPVVQMVTNGTRLDEEADFLAGLRRKPFVGISLDVPTPIHDRVRRKRGLFRKIEMAIPALKARRVPIAISSTIFGPGVSSVLPEGNLEAAGDLISFSRAHDIPINIQPCSPTQARTRIALGEILLASDYPGLVNSPSYNEVLIRGHDGRCRYNWTNISYGTDGRPLHTRPGDCYFCDDCLKCYYSCVWEPTLLTSRRATASARHFLKTWILMTPAVHRAISTARKLL